MPVVLKLKPSQLCALAGTVFPEDIASLAPSLKPSFDRDEPRAYLQGFASGVKAAAKVLDVMTRDQSTVDGPVVGAIADVLELQACLAARSFVDAAREDLEASWPPLVESRGVFADVASEIRRRGLLDVDEMLESEPAVNELDIEARDWLWSWLTGQTSVNWWLLRAEREPWRLLSEAAAQCPMLTDWRRQFRYLHPGQSIEMTAGELLAEYCRRHDFSLLTLSPAGVVQVGNHYGLRVGLSRRLGVFLDLVELFGKELPIAEVRDFDGRFTDLDELLYVEPARPLQ